MSPVQKISSPVAQPSRVIVAEYTRTVHHGGNTYFATAAMAEIFETRASTVAAAGETELVPLLHSRGVDLLLISPTTKVLVVAIEIGTPVRRER